MSDNDHYKPDLILTPAPHSLLRRLWRGLRGSVKSKPWFSSVLVNLIYGWLSLVHQTNKMVIGAAKPEVLFETNQPFIVAMWHGQHIMMPFLAPKNAKVVALFSKSLDAEVNAKLVERRGFETIRGSGGRDPSQSLEKGGAKALIALKRALDTGKSVVMIADISKSTPRQSGLGIVTLARLTGRPIVGVAYASSRRHVLVRSWDKTTINLPFGRACVIATEPIYIARDADEATMQAMRQQLDARLNTATNEAYKMVDKRA